MTDRPRLSPLVQALANCLAAHAALWPDAEAAARAAGAVDVKAMAEVIRQLWADTEKLPD